jgi:Spy/CpxP family protein refolding chaperone
MHSKYILLVSVNLLIGTPTAFADNNDSVYSGWQGHRLNRLSGELSLTSEQKSKLESILNDQSEELRTIHEETHKEIMEVLNAEQFAKWENLYKQRNENRLKRWNDEQK